MPLITLKVPNKTRKYIIKGVQEYIDYISKGKSKKYNWDGLLKLHGYNMIINSEYVKHGLVYIPNLNKNYKTSEDKRIAVNVPIYRIKVIYKINPIDKDEASSIKKCLN